MGLSSLDTSKAFFEHSIIPFNEANLSIASSAVLYGLSVYTVFPVCLSKDKQLVAFRLPEHFKRLLESARIIGMDDFEKNWHYTKFVKAIKELVAANNIKEDVFVRATVHVNEQVPGTKSRGLKNTLSIFI